MDIDVIGWLMDCYKEGSLTNEEIEEALNDPAIAYSMFRELVTMDPTGWGEDMQRDIKEFKTFYLPSIKISKPAVPSDGVD